MEAIRVTDYARNFMLLFWFVIWYWSTGKSREFLHDYPVHSPRNERTFDWWSFQYYNLLAKPPAHPFPLDELSLPFLLPFQPLFGTRKFRSAEASDNMASSHASLLCEKLLQFSRDLLSKLTNQNFAFTSERRNYLKWIFIAGVTSLQPPFFTHFFGHTNHPPLPPTP